MESAVIKEGWRTECIIWIYNSDGYNWQCLDRLFCFLQINLGFSVEIQVGQIYYLAFVFYKHCFDLIDKMGPKRKRRKNLKKTHLQGLSGEIQLLTYRAGRRENRGREGGGGRETTEGGDKGIKPGGQKPHSHSQMKGLTTENLPSPKSSQPPKEMTERQHWLQDKQVVLCFQRQDWSSAVHSLGGTWYFLPV